MRVYKIGSERVIGMHTLIRVVFLFAFGASALAQGNTGSMTGTITDASKAVVGNATVQVKNTATGAVHTAVSSNSGDFTISQLSAGNYDLSVRAFFYTPFEQQNIVLRPAQSLRLDINLGDNVTLDTLGDSRADFAAIFAKTAKPPSGPTPRMPDGKPDLSGIWTAPMPASPGLPEIQPLPWAQAVTKERHENYLKDAPSSRCLPFNLTFFFFLQTKFVQTSKLLVVIIAGDTPPHREVFLDREHPKNLEPTWTGHSIGKWEGDTLVVDTVGFNDKSWLDLDGHPHTEKLHIVQRFRRPDLGHLEVETTFEDPGAYVKPWTTKGVSVLTPDDEIEEYICNENNQDVEHLIGK